MLKVLAIYEFDVLGDGIQKEMLIPMRALKAPDPIQDNAIPSGVLKVDVGPSPGGGTVTMEGEFMHLRFDTAPPSGKPTAVAVTALFGTERIKPT